MSTLLFTTNRRFLRKQLCVLPIRCYPKEEGWKETNPIGYNFVAHSSCLLVQNTIPFKVQIFLLIAATGKYLAIKNRKTADILNIWRLFFCSSNFAKTQKINKRMQDIANAMVCCRLALCVRLYNSSDATPTPPYIVSNWWLRSK